jgi:hypothetical protein
VNDNVVGVTDNGPGVGEAVAMAVAVAVAVGVGEALAVAIGTVFTGPPHAASTATNANAPKVRKLERITRRSPRENTESS